MCRDARHCQGRNDSSGVGLESPRCGLERSSFLGVRPSPQTAAWRISSPSKRASSATRTSSCREKLLPSSVRIRTASMRNILLSLWRPNGENMFHKRMFWNTPNAGWAVITAQQFSKQDSAGIVKRASFAAVCNRAISPIQPLRFARGGYRLLRQLKKVCLQPGIALAQPPRQCLRDSPPGLWFCLTELIIVVSL